MARRGPVALGQVARKHALAGPNPYMASAVNRRTADGGRVPLLPRRYNRTAVDRFAPGYTEGFRRWRQHEAAPNTYPRVGRRAAQRGSATAGSSPAPKKRLRTPAPASQSAGLTPRRAVPVRHWLGGRAASGRVVPAVRWRSVRGPVAVPVTRMARWPCGSRQWRWNSSSDRPAFLTMKA